MLFSLSSKKAQRWSDRHHAGHYRSPCSTSTYQSCCGRVGVFAFRGISLGFNSKDACGRR
jgi:hypothetical protein